MMLFEGIMMILMYMISFIVTIENKSENEYLPDNKSLSTNNYETLDDATNALKEWFEYNDTINDVIFTRLLEFVEKDMYITWDEIDSMLLVCNLLLDNKLFNQYEQFIMKCPKKFVVVYSNNSEKTPHILHNLQKNGITNVKDYLIENVNPDFLKTWRGRHYEYSL